MGADVVLDVRHLSVEYAADSGAVHAVEDVSFTLERGQILGLAGESGSGKSTLAYAVARLIKPPAVVTAGEVLYFPKPSERAATANELAIEGVDLELGETVNLLNLTPAQLRAFRWRTLSFVFQSAMNALNPVLSIRAQIVDVLRAHHPQMNKQERENRARELVRLVGISADRLGSFPHELSGGMRQRAVIAIALALNPEVIILDEPTTALDVVVQREILAVLMGLRDEFGFSVIFITHDLSLLLEIADRVAIMYAGRIVEMADGVSIYRHARHPYTYGLLHSFPSLRGPRKTMTGIPGSPPDLRELPPGCAFHPRCAYALPVCQELLPVLRSVPGGGAGNLVACHLHDDALNPEGVPAELRGLETTETASGTPGMNGAAGGTTGTEHGEPLVAGTKGEPA